MHAVTEFDCFLQEISKVRLEKTGGKAKTQHKDIIAPAAVP